MTIALGYSLLTLPGGRSLSMIDVPGHERLVRTMVAGASGIDMFLLAVAADDGVMPQTREHVRSCGRSASGMAWSRSRRPISPLPSAPRWKPSELLPGAPVLELLCAHRLRARRARARRSKASPPGSRRVPGAAARRCCTSIASSRSAAPERW